MLGEILDNQLSDDPAKQALGKKQAALYTSITGQRAGAAAEATKAGDQPSVNVNQEASALEKGFTPQKPISELDYMMGQQQGHFDTKVPYSQYLSGIDDLNNKAKQKASDLADGYRRAASKNPNLTGSQYRDMQQAAPPPAASSSNSGSAWQPK